MSATYLFTTQELATLITRSKAMAHLSPENLAEVTRLTESPTSPKSQALYRILIAERETYKQIEKEYLQESNKIVAEFQIEITAQYTEKLRQEQRSAEHKVKHAEAQAAQELLNTLQQN